jgi:hypothetical protein
MAGKGKPGPAPGQRFGGRKKGTPNKVTADIKAMTLAALSAEGGVEYLRQQARENPNAFMSLLGRILPTQVNATVRTEARELTDAELVAIASGAGIAEQATGEDEPSLLH